MSDWIDEITEFAKVMTGEEHKRILGMTDLFCEKCGTCCIMPDLKYLNKPPGKRCQHLTEDNLCEIHENKPEPCMQFPYMSRFQWVVEFRLGTPRNAIAFCDIVKKFWMEAYRYLKLWKSSETCQTCDACQVCDTCQMEV